MFTREIATVSAVENGFLLRIERPPSASVAKECPCLSSYDEESKTVFVKTVDDVAAAIKAVLPLLSVDSSTDEFNSAFERIAK